MSDTAEIIILSILLVICIIILIALIRFKIKNPEEYERLFPEPKKNHRNRTIDHDSIKYTHPRMKRYYEKKNRR